MSSIKPAYLLFIFFFFLVTATAIPYSHNYPTESSCVNWNQYYTNCTQLGNNPFQGTISFDNIGLAWVAIFLVIITFFSLIFVASTAEIEAHVTEKTKFLLSLSFHPSCCKLKAVSNSTRIRQIEVYWISLHR